MKLVDTMTSPTRIASSPSVRESVFSVMRSFGCDTIFGNPGSTELPMFRDFPSDLRYVLGLQEAVVVAMADGYAQASGRVGFVNLHSAAGVGNAMGNIYTAFKNQTPLVIIAGQQARSILPFDPYLASPQATELPKPYVKWSIEPSRAEDVPFAVATACHRALQAPCGPVLVSVPVDDWDRLGGAVESRRISRTSRPDPSVLAEVADLLDGATSPAFVVGAEVDRDGAFDKLIQLAEIHSAAVYTAPLSSRCSFPEDHPLFSGFLPADRVQIVQRLAAHDVIFVIGAPVFTYHVEGKGPHLPDHAQLCHLTQDAEAAARAPRGISLVSGIRLTLEELLGMSNIAARLLPTPRKRAERVSAGSVMSVAYVLQTLADLRSPDDVIVEEAPTARPVMHEHLPILREKTFLTMASGGLGFAMPAAAGVAMAQPRRRTICVIGDGSSMYSIQALWTAAQLQLGVTYIVLNNRRYAALNRFGGILGFPADQPLPGTQISGLDFVALARGHGCSAERIEHPDEVPKAMQRALQARGPYLLEVIVP